MLNAKIISGLDKAYPNGQYTDFKELCSLSALKGEKVSFQLLLAAEICENGNYNRHYVPEVSGELAPYVKLRQVKHVPATNNGRGLPDEDYYSIYPCLVPDLLTPLQFSGKINVTSFNLTSVWIDLKIPADLSLSGKSTLSFTLKYIPPASSTSEPFSTTKSIEINVIDATLPQQKIKFTQWFHSDCLADYYQVEKWSEEHLQICEKFITTAKNNGINMIYTPLITPPLDDASGNRDLQLADVTVTDSGEYVFGWTKLDKWLEILDRVGIKYIEVGHLFTQGGAAYATKVHGYKNGSYQRLFPANTPCDDPEYAKFLRALLTSFIAYMKNRGDDNRLHFHISDEPRDEHLDCYLRAKNTVADLLEGYTVMDALSHYEFYAKGVVEHPVVLMKYLDEFLENNVQNLWAYNCCSPDRDHSNRFLSMSSTRNRSICLMLFKFGFDGFLHWGYNFYYNAGSWDLINPFIDTTSGDVFPSGDAFSVYPGRNGDPLESMRLLTFRDALQDLSALELCASLYSKEEVVSVLEQELGTPITPRTYLNDSEPMLRIRGRINSMIEAKSAK